MKTTNDSSVKKVLAVGAANLKPAVHFASTKSNLLILPQNNAREESDRRGEKKVD
jgi:hypothetical protein